VHVDDECIVHGRASVDLTPQLHAARSKPGQGTFHLPPQEAQLSAFICDLPFLIRLSNNLACGTTFEENHARLLCPACFSLISFLTILNLSCLLQAHQQLSISCIIHWTESY
jgi:hypothetical protein